MADTTSIARIGELTQRLDAVLARIDALEASACECASCCAKKRDAELAARRERFARIASLPDAERVVAIDAMDAYTRAAFLYALPADVAIAETVARAERLGPSSREASIDELAPALRDRARVEFVALPSLVELRLAPGRKPEPRAPIVIGMQYDDFTGRPVSQTYYETQLAAVGLERTVGHTNAGTVYRSPLALGHGTCQTFTSEQVAVMRTVDRRFDEAVERGEILARELSVAETKTHLVEEWRHRMGTMPVVGKGARS